MSNLPQPVPTIKKTIGEIAKQSNQPNKKLSLGSQLNSRAESELAKFVGQQVTLKSGDEIITGVCVACSVTMALVIRTDTEKIFIRHWAWMRRARVGDGRDGKK